MEKPALTPQSPSPLVPHQKETPHSCLPARYSPPPVKKLENFVMENTPPLLLLFPFFEPPQSSPSLARLVSSISSLLWEEAILPTFILRAKLLVKFRHPPLLFCLLHPSSSFGVPASPPPAGQALSLKSPPQKLPGFKNSVSVPSRGEKASCCKSSHTGKMELPILYQIGNTRQKVPAIEGGEGDKSLCIPPPNGR